MKKDLKYVLIFFIFAVIMLWKLIFLKHGFIAGDYMSQFYPWSISYSQALKSFSFPYWINYNGAGFNLMAESQIGGYYPLNIVLYFLLPFKIAYNYSAILHFLLAGIFVYIYCRHMNIDGFGSLLAGILFCFGSASAGAMVNISTLKVMTFFPFVLHLIEKYLNKKAYRYLITAGIISGIQFLAGSVQIAFYCVLFYVIYYISVCMVRKTVSLKKNIIDMSIYLFFTVAISLPQTIQTYNMAQLSARQQMGAGFALWGSFPPFGFLSMVFPYQASALISPFYLSIIGVYFLIIGFSDIKMNKNLIPLSVIALISFVFALGKYTPVYPLILNMFNISLMRNPSKFLLFLSFCLSVFAGYGFNRIIHLFKEGKKLFLIKMFNSVILFFLSVFFIMKIILHFYSDKILYLAKQYVTANIYGRPFHRYSLEVYMHKTESILELVKSKFMLLNSPVNIASLLIVVVTIIFLYFSPKIIKRKNVFRPAALVIILFDLYIFNFYGTAFGNILNYNYIKPETAIEQLNILRKDDSLYRIIPLNARYLPKWCRPNSNAIFNIESIGIYTPLVDKKYFNEFKRLGCVDDSMGLSELDRDYLNEKIGELKKFNVKYLISPSEIIHSDLDMISNQDNVYMYRLNGFYPRVYFSGLQPGGNGIIQILSYKQGFLSLSVNSTKKQKLVFSERFSSVWRACVDKKYVPIEEEYGYLQSIEVPEGKHNVVFFVKDMAKNFR